MHAPWRRHSGKYVAVRHGARPGVRGNGRVFSRRPEGYRGTTMALQAATTPDRLFERERELEAIRAARSGGAGSGHSVASTGRPASARPRCSTPRTRPRRRRPAGPPRTRCGARAGVRLRDRPPAVRRGAARRHVRSGDAVHRRGAVLRPAARGRRRRRRQLRAHGRPLCGSPRALLAAVEPRRPAAFGRARRRRALGRQRVAGRARPHRQPPRGHPRRPRSWRAAARSRCRRSTTCAGRPRRTGPCSTCRRSARRPPPPSSGRWRRARTTPCAASVTSRPR